MNIQPSQSSLNTKAVSIQAKQQAPSPEETQDTVFNELPEDEFSWGDLGKGIVGSVVGGAVVGVGGAVTGLLKTPRITYEAVKGVWKSEMLGPVLKATVTPVVLAAGLAAPVLTAIGATGYGLFQGFGEAARKNPLAAATKGMETVKDMNGKVSEAIVEGIREAATEKPESADDVYEIKIVEGVKGLATSATSAVVGSVGIGATTALHVPGGYLRATSEIWQSEAPAPLKVGGQLLATAGAVLAVPLGIAGGAVYGLGMGAYKGYTEGFVAGNRETLEGIGDFHKMAKEAIYED